MEFDVNLYSSKNEEYFSNDRQEMLSFVPSDVSSVLDVGCSAGGFGRLLKSKRGCEVWGIEPSISALKAAEFLDNVIHDSFHPGVNFNGKKFDAIIFNDVLEHLTNPWDTLILSKEILRDRGYIIASIPNVQCYSVIKELIYKGDWKYGTSGILDKSHYRFFTRKSIIRMFQETGFEIETIEGENSVLMNSRLLRFLHFLFPKRIEPFLYINYAIRVRNKKLSSST